MIVDGAAGWYMSAEKYVRAAVKNVEQKIGKSNQRLPTGCKTPMYGYWPENDTFTELKTEGVTQYKEMVGLLRWAVELRLVGILLEIALMSTYLSFHCRGHI